MKSMKQRVIEIYIAFFPHVEEKEYTLHEVLVNLVFVWLPICLFLLYVITSK